MVDTQRVVGVVCTCDEAGRDCRRPEPVPGARETDTGVGREQARVQTDDQHPHAGTHRVRQHPRPCRLDVEPFLAVVDERVDAEAGAFDHVPELCRGPPREVPAGKAVVDVLPVAVGRDLHVQRAAEGERAVQVRERQRQLGRRDVHVGLVGPRAGERRGAERQPLEIGDDRPGTGRERAHLGRHRRRGIERDHRHSEVAAVPTGTTADIGTHAGRDASDERVQRGRARPASMLDPVPDVVLVDVDGLAIHQTTSRGAVLGDVLRAAEGVGTEPDTSVGSRAHADRTSSGFTRRSCTNRSFAHELPRLGQICSHDADATESGTAQREHQVDVVLPGQVRVVEDVPHAFARVVAEIAPRSIALSGGETARLCYVALHEEPVDWLLVEVFFGDERIIPVESEESNEGMARRALLDAVQPRAVHSMVGLGADRYDSLVRSAPPIDIVHLGLGPDGHTASLFPGSAALDERERFVVENEDDDHPIRRITFTFPAIERAHLALVTVAGEDKREAIERIKAGEELPGARIRAERVLWLGDRAALGD